MQAKNANLVEADAVDEARALAVELAGKAWQVGHFLEVLVADRGADRHIGPKRLYQVQPLVDRVNVLRDGGKKSRGMGGVSAPSCCESVGGLEEEVGGSSQRRQHAFDEGVGDSSQRRQKCKHGTKRTAINMRRACQDRALQHITL